MSVIITNVMAVSLDGCIGKYALESDGERRSYGFTNMDDREWVREQLVTADAVITGANSLRASGATWKLLNDRGRTPSWIVLTTKGIDAALPFWLQHDVDRILVSPKPVQENLCLQHQVVNWQTGETNPAQYIVERLESSGLHRVLLFGGGAINKIFYEKNLVDYAKLTISPIIVGGIDAPHFVNPGLTHDVKMSLISSVIKGNLVFLNYKIQK